MESPDVASGLVNAWHVDSYIFSYRPLGVLGISKHSTGTSSLFPDINSGPTDQFVSELGSNREQLDPRLSGRFISEVAIANELLQFRAKYFPDDSIRPDLQRWLQWFADAAPRFTSRYDDVVAAIKEMAEKNNLNCNNLKILPSAPRNTSSFRSR